MSSNSIEREKEKKKIKNRRSGRTMKIVGYACLIFGLYDLVQNFHWFNYSLVYGLQASFLPFALAAIGAGVIWYTKKNVEKWDRYDVFINQNGNTSLRMISRKMGVPVDTVRKDIQKMINNGFFKDENGQMGAYIHGEYDILVMMRNGVPIEPVEETVKKEKEKEKAEAAVESTSEGDVNSADRYLALIEQAAIETDDPDVSDSLRSIGASVKKINKKIKRNPELEKLESVKQLQNIYLPKTMELIEKLRYKDAGSVAMLEIKGILNTCAVAYGNIVEKVYKSEDEDTIIDIEVLKQTFEREGLLGSDFDLE